MNQIQNEAVMNSMAMVLGVWQEICLKRYPQNLQSHLFNALSISTCNHIQLRSKSKICLNYATANNISFVFGYLHSTNIIPLSPNNNINLSHQFVFGVLQTICNQIANRSANHNGHSDDAKHDGTTGIHHNNDDTRHGHQGDAAAIDNDTNSITDAYITDINKGNNRNPVTVPSAAAPPLTIAEPIPSLLPNNNNNSNNRPDNGSYHHIHHDGINRMQSEPITNAKDESHGPSIYESNSDNDDEDTDNDQETEEEEDSDVEIIGPSFKSNSFNQCFRDRFIRHQSSMNQQHLSSMPRLPPTSQQRQSLPTRTSPIRSPSSSPSKTSHRPSPSQSKSHPFCGGLPDDVRAMFQHPSPINHLYRTDPQYIADNPYQCEYPLCNFRCKHPGQLKPHYSVHWDKKPFICKFKKCNKSYKSIAGLRRHQKGEHPPINSLRSAKATSKSQYNTRKGNR